MARLAVRLLDGPHRLQFLFAALCGLMGASVWLWLPEALDPVSLHVRLLLAGMAQCAVCGYILTALPGWTGSARFGALASAGFAALSLIAIGALLVPCPILPFLPALPALGVTITAALRFLRSPVRWRALVLGFLVPLVAGWAGLAVPTVAEARPSPKITVLLLAGLIALVAGRALPAFAGFWMPEPEGGVERAGATKVPSAPGLLLLGAAALLLLEDAGRPSGILLCLAAMAFLLQVSRWPIRAALSYPSLLILFLSFLWLPAGLFLFGSGLALPNPAIGASEALHALTTGAISTMIYGFMARPAMQRRQGRLRLGVRLGGGYALLTLAAFLRIALGPFGPGSPAMTASAAALAAGWLLFLAAYVPSLAAPAPRPVFSAAHPAKSVP